MATTQPPPAVSLTQIGQIAVYVDDIDRAVAFYRDTLGPFELGDRGVRSGAAGSHVRVWKVLEC